MIRLLPIIILCACGASQSEPVYPSVATLCTAAKQRIIDTAATPPTERQQARFEATVELCNAILAEIEGHE
jgi:hypothetical protein